MGGIVILLGLHQMELININFTPAAEEDRAGREASRRYSRRVSSGADFQLRLDALCGTCAGGGACCGGF